MCSRGYTYYQNFQIGVWEWIPWLDIFAWRIVIWWRSCFQNRLGKDQTRSRSNIPARSRLVSPRNQRFYDPSQQTTTWRTIARITGCEEDGCSESELCTSRTHGYCMVCRHDHRNNVWTIWRKLNPFNQRYWNCPRVASAETHNRSYYPRNVLWYGIILRDHLSPRGYSRSDRIWFLTGKFSKAPICSYSSSTAWLNSYRPNLRTLFP